MGNAILDQQEIQEQAEKSWEKINSELPKGVNPHAYMFGFKACAQWIQERENANWQELKQFLYNEIIERRDYSSSKSFEVVLEEMERLIPSPPKD